MNQFSSIESSEGLLKNDYVGEALKRKREKLSETKLGLLPGEAKREIDAQGELS